MNAWIELNQVEYDDVWDRFYAHFQFRPDCYEQQRPAIREPSPSVVIDLSGDYDDTALDDLAAMFFASFRTLAAQGHEKLYALDWQHTSYWYYPLRPAPYPLLTVFPDGDYFSFLAPDFSFGTFGHPWQQSLCVFGKSLLSTLPDLKQAGPILRQSGPQGFDKE